MADTSIVNDVLESKILSLDLIDMILGDRLGEGQDREVFEYRPNPSLVIKVETGNGVFQNAMEWEMWKAAAQTKAAQWLAPCCMISSCGCFLIMERTLPAIEYPEKVPEFLGDLKPDNFGTYDGRFVAHDYGTLVHRRRGLSMRMVKAHWYTWFNGTEVPLTRPQ